MNSNRSRAVCLALATNVCLGWGILILAPTVQADVRLPHIISSGMVVQRDVPIQIWGWADAGERVSVYWDGALANNAKSAVESVADANGKWEVELPAKQADGVGHRVTIRGKNTVELDDVLIGDVWLGSGQSNMEMPMTETGDTAAIASSANSQIRLFHVTHAQAPEPTSDVDAAWRQCDADRVATFSAPLYFFGQRLQVELDVPIGLINASWGGSPIEQWLPANNPPGEMYNAMIAPLHSFPIRGLLWYQGEANVNRNDEMQYADQMKALIEGWRAAWNQDLPFYYVQIAPWDYSGYIPERVPVLREAQAACMKIPSTGMVVTTDLVDPAGLGDGHPRNKRDVGERLARWALAKTYGRKDVQFCGPICTSAVAEGQRIRMRFQYDTGLKSIDGEPLREFEIAGTNGHFAEAIAEIDGDTVVVSSPLVPAPTQVRFAWRNLTRPNLANAANLPAVPFRITTAGLSRD